MSTSPDCPSPQAMCHGCIVMASGMATRFGSNKLMVSLGGIPLVEHVLRATDGLFARRVVVMRHAEVAQLCQARGVEVVLHDEPARNDTVRLGVQAMRGCDTVTFVQADQPLIGRETIVALLEASQTDPGAIWRASFEGTPAAPVLFPAWAFDELCRLPAGKGGGFVAKAHRERVRLVEVRDPWELFDVDTVDDLLELQTHLEGRDAQAGEQQA